VVNNKENPEQPRKFRPSKYDRSLFLVTDAPTEENWKSLTEVGHRLADALDEHAPTRDSFAAGYATAYKYAYRAGFASGFDAIYPPPEPLPHQQIKEQGQKKGRGGTHVQEGEEVTDAQLESFTAGYVIGYKYGTDFGRSDGIAARENKGSVNKLGRAIFDNEEAMRRWPAVDLLYQDIEDVKQEIWDLEEEQKERFTQGRAKEIKKKEKELADFRKRVRKGRP
jgi:hypothetical protein